jgi:hypothetical protein
MDPYWLPLELIVTNLAFCGSMASLARSSKDFLIKMAEGLHLISKRLLQLTEGIFTQGGALCKFIKKGIIDSYNIYSGLSPETYEEVTKGKKTHPIIIL